MLLHLEGLFASLDDGEARGKRFCISCGCTGTLVELQPVKGGGHVRLLKGRAVLCLPVERWQKPPGTIS